MPSVKEKVAAARAKRKAAAEAAEKNRAVPQRRPSALEPLLYAVIGLLYVMAGAMPSTALFLLPFITVGQYLLYRRFGIYLPAAMLAVYGVISLVCNYDILTVIFLCYLIFALAGSVIGAQFTPYLACMAITIISGALGFLTGLGVVRLAEGKPVENIVKAYIVAERDDPFIKFLAQDIYESAKIPEDIGRVEPDDPLYDPVCAAYLATVAGNEAKDYAWYYCIHFGAVFGAVAYVCAVCINRRTASPSDEGVIELELNLSTRALGGCYPEKNRLADMSFPRAFLWTCILPAAVAGIALELVGGYEALSATIMHVFVTLPTAVCFFTLLCFFASLFKGRARVAAYIVLYLIGAAMVMFPLALFIGSIIGVCDVILNLRFWTKFLMEE